MDKISWLATSSLKPHHCALREDAWNVNVGARILGGKVRGEALPYPRTPPLWHRPCSWTSSDP